MKVSAVIWRDIQASSEWYTLDEAKEWGAAAFKELHTTVGEILFKNDKYLIIAATKDGSLKKPKFNDVSMILMDAVVRIEKR